MNIFSIIFRIRMKYASSNKRADLMKEKFHHIGSNVNLYTTEFGTEPYLISIGDNVNVAAGVKFITHDISVFNVSRYLGLERLDKVGKIELNDNCFIGAFSILMPNISVGKNSIIAAGSVVTKNVPANEIWGGESCAIHHDCGRVCAQVD